MWVKLLYVILFNGQVGIGKCDFVMYFVQSLLCDMFVVDGQLCGICVVCNWFVQGNYLDFYFVCLEVMEDVFEMEKDVDGKKKVLSKIICMEQVCNLIEGVGVGMYWVGLWVVVLYLFDVLQIEGVNVLLKMLEELLQNIVFLLVMD